MTLAKPPIINKITEKDGKPNLSWIQFFNEAVQGDLGTEWTPSFESLTEVGGSAAKSGRYYQINASLSNFRIDITPVTNTSAVAGTTYIDNFPLQVNANGLCASVSGNLGGSLGVVRASDGRIYVPDWTTVTSIVSVIGIVEAS